jgi:pimeloyl-ACP methyl ester carboxylesterase
MCEDHSPPVPMRAVLHDVEVKQPIKLEPVDSVEIVCLMDNVTDVFMPDQGPARVVKERVLTDATKLRSRGITIFDELAGTLTGPAGDRPPLVLLHGLTFDRRQWAPLLRELDAVEPDRRVLTLDLPGHGESLPQPDYRMARVAGLVERAVSAAGLEPPVVIGHSIGGVIATEYAARFPARGVVNLDQPLLPGPFGALVRGAEPTLSGPDWRAFWDGLLAGMGIASLPAEARALVAQTSAPRADLLLGYWDEILHGSDAAIAAQRRENLAGIAAKEIGYRWVTSAQPAPAYAQWLSDVLPGIKITVLPGGHFPHLGYPGELAKMLA